MSEFMFFIFGVLLGIFICAQSFEDKNPKRKYYIEIPTKYGIDTLYLTE